MINGQRFRRCRLKGKYWALLPILLVAACTGGGGGGGANGAAPQAFSNLGNNPLNYASWGPWAAGGDITAQPTGTRTPPPAVPTAGSATYRGLAVGKVFIGPPPGTREGTVEIVANFGTRAIETRFDFSALDFDAVGTISGNSYTAAGTDFVAVSLTPLVLEPCCFTRVDGAFYGPAAQETAGTFSNEGIDTTTGATIFLLRGSFGATRQ